MYLLRPSKWLITIILLFVGHIPNITFAEESAIPVVPTTERSKRAIKNNTPIIQEHLSMKGLSLGSPIFIRIFKEESELEVWIESSNKTFQRYKTYPICTFSGELGPKERQGDQQSPEGFYYVGPKQMNPWSQYHLSFNLGYPNRYDRAWNRTGSALMVHGNCVSIGCFAMTDKLIEEIYTLASAALNNGQPYFRVHSFPFRMTAANLKRHSANPWQSFWINMKQGFDWFEEHNIPPNVEVRNKSYLFSE